MKEGVQTSGEGWRRGNAPSPLAQERDRLPPWSERAEQGALGCCLLDGSLVATVQARFEAADGDLFFDLRHAALFEALAGLEAEGKPRGRDGGIDPILLSQRLADLGRVEQVGGMPYVAGLMNCVPAASSLPEYLGILWEKFLARRWLESSARSQDLVREANGFDERTLGGVERRFEEFKALADRNFGMAPAVLKRAGAFGEAAYQRWFGQVEECPGWTLPFAFPLGFRKGELTLLSGDNGSGKTSLLSQVAIDVAKQMEAAGSEERICVASFEMSPDVSVWIAQRQLLGRGTLPDTPAGHDALVAATAWLNKWFWFHDFVGIGNWRDVLDVFRYARDHEGCRFFQLDSVMRIGIPEDDLAQQSLAAAAFASFAMESGKESHLMVVSHENKGGEGAKNRVQGSKRWTDNAHLFCQMQRNEKKGLALAEAAELEAGQDDERAEAAKLRTKWETAWDARFLLHKQRYPGARQNGSAHLFFDGGKQGSLQFRKRYGDGPVNYLGKRVEGLGI